MPTKLAVLTGTLVLATATPSLAALPGPTRPAVTMHAPAAVRTTHCDPKNPGHRRGDTDVAAAIGQAPPRVGAGLEWWMYAGTNPDSPGVHVENWGHEWFQDVRKDSSGVHASGDLVGGYSGTHYLDYQVDVFTDGRTPSACASANTG